MFKADISVGLFSFRIISVFSAEICFFGQFTLNTSLTDTYTGKSPGA